MQKNSFVIKKCIKTGLKKKKKKEDTTSEKKKKVLYSFSQFVELLFCMFAFLGRQKKWLPHWWCVRKIINDGVEALTRKSQACFQIICLMLGRASHETNLKPCLRFPCRGLNTVIDSVNENPFCCFLCAGRSLVEALFTTTADNIC